MSDDSARIEGYLERLRETGTLDSEGHFTVSGHRAIGKLASFLLADPSHWILKIVQAATRLEAKEIRIQQCASSTQVRIHLDTQLHMADLASALTSATHEPKQPGLKELAAGLRAVGVGQHRDWVAQVTAQNRYSLITCRQGELEANRIESSHNRGSQIVLGVAYPSGQSGKLGGLIRFGEAIQNEHMTLLLNARACPIPLYLDGRRLDDLAEPKIATALQSRIFLGINARPGFTEDVLTVPHGISPLDGFHLKDAFGEQAPFYLSNFTPVRTAHSIQRWYFNYTLTKELRGPKTFHPQSVPSPSRVFLVRHGVVVGKRNLGAHHPISVDVFLNGENLRSDLTGLKVEPSSAEIEEAKEEIRNSEDFLNELVKKLMEHSPKPVKHQALLYGGLGIVGLMMPAFALKAVAGTVSTILLARSAHRNRILSDLCLKHLFDFRSRLKPTERH